MPKTIDFSTKKSHFHCGPGQILGPPLVEGFLKLFQAFSRLFLVPLNVLVHSGATERSDSERCRRGPERDFGARVLACSGLFGRQDTTYKHTAALCCCFTCPFDLYSNGCILLKNINYRREYKATIELSQKINPKP